MKDKNFILWLKHNLFWTWHKKYQKEELFQNFINNMTEEQKQGYYKQYLSDKLKQNEKNNIKNQEISESE